MTAHSYVPLVFVSDRSRWRHASTVRAKSRPVTLADPKHESTRIKLAKAHEARRKRGEGATV